MLVNYQVFLKEFYVVFFRKKIGVSLHLDPNWGRYCPTIREAASWFFKFLRSGDTKDWEGNQRKMSYRSYVDNGRCEDPHYILDCKKIMTLFYEFTELRVSSGWQIIDDFFEELVRLEKEWEMPVSFGDDDFEEDDEEDEISDDDWNEDDDWNKDDGFEKNDEFGEDENAVPF